MNAGTTSFFLIGPAYNEAARISEPLFEMGAWLSQHSDRSEIIVVDDSNDDETCDVVRQTAPKLPTSLRLIRYRPNRGKGYALEVGFAVAAGDVPAFTDCDLSTSLDILTLQYRFEAWLLRHLDLPFGVSVLCVARRAN